MSQDYFDLRKEFLAERRIDLSSDFKDRFNMAINNRQFCAKISLMDELEFKKFHHRVKNVFARLDSLGFSLFIMRQEENAWENFIKKVHNPRNPADPLLKKFFGTVIVGEEPTSLFYAFESFLFFADSYFEYLSKALGIIFKEPHAKYIKKLIIHLEKIDDPTAKKLVKILNKYHSLWEEMQVDGQRPYFENVEPLIEHSTNGVSLRDMVGHHRSLKMSAIQMSIAPTGEVTKERLQSGAFRQGDKNIPWGDFEKGIVKQAEKYLNDLLLLQTEIFDVLIDKLPKE